MLYVCGGLRITHCVTSDLADRLEEKFGNHVMTHGSSLSMVTLVTILHHGSPLDCELHRNVTGLARFWR